MSTKVYSGYKVKLDKLHLAIDWFHIAMWQRVVAVAGPSIATFDDVKAVREAYAECGFHVWIDGEKGEALFSLFGMPPFTEPRRAKFKPWVFPRWIKEFGYWNNVDPPDGMRHGAGYRRWKERGKQWDRVALDGDRWELRMTLMMLPKDSYRDMALANECIAKFRESWKVTEDQLLSRKKLPR